MSGRDLNFEAAGLMPTDDEVAHNHAYRERFELEDAEGTEFESAPPPGYADVPDDAITAWVSQAAHDLVLFYEVGGRDGYLRKYQHPTRPPGASGVTIGFGYDLGHHAIEEVEAAWASRLPAADYATLARSVGLKGDAAERAKPSVERLIVPWQAATEVYRQQTVPKYARWVLSIYPGAEKIHPDCFGALFSLVYNRGRKLSGASRQEMKNIRDHILAERYDKVPAEIREMKRLWAGRNMSGLLKRRDAEASLFEAGLHDLDEAQHQAVSSRQDHPAPLESYAGELVQARHLETADDTVAAIVQAIESRDWLRARAATAAALKSNSLSDTHAKNFLRLVSELEKQSTFDQLGQGQRQTRIGALIDDIRNAAGKGQDGSTRLSPKIAAAKAGELYDLIVQSGRALPSAQSAELLGHLKSVRAFSGLSRIGDRLIANGSREPSIRKLTAQGLIDTGQLTAALDCLSELIRTTSPDNEEHVDALGLIGRVHKQIYIDASRPGMTPAEQGNVVAVEALRQAIIHYAKGYDEARPGPTSYHGINLVALLKRAERDRVVPAVPLRADALAHAIIADLEAPASGKINQWDAATIGEAYLALSNWDRAAAAYGEFASRADAFALAGAIRQLEEVWGIGADTSEPGQILAGLKTRLLLQERGQIELTVDERAALKSASPRTVGSNFEKVINQNDTRVAADWFLLGAHRCQTVARVNTIWGEAVGTGFLVRGGDFIEGYGDRRLFVTNNHVVTTKPDGLGNTPKQVQIIFDGIGDTAGRNKFVCKKVLWESLHHDLDATLIELHPSPDHLPFCPVAFERPVPQKSQLVIIGHPAGKNLTVSLYDSRLLDFGPKDTNKPQSRYLHYQTATEGGSSGSPVFDHRNWQLVGLHHAGPQLQSGTLPRLGGQEGAHEANEGIDIHSIRERIAAEIKAAPRHESADLGGSGPTFERAARSRPPGDTRHNQFAPRAPGSAAGTLVENLPRKMAVGVPQLVEVRISGAQSARLMEELAGGGDVLSHDIAIAAAMNVELTSPSGGIHVIPIKSKPQVINREDLEGDQPGDASWQWRLEPIASGKHQLQLIVSSQEIVERGVIAERAQVSQIIPINVQINFGRIAWSVARWGGVAASGSLVGYYAQKFITGL